MRVLQCIATRALLALLLACAATPAMATIINHCVGATGTPVFTDQPCTNLDALPAYGSSAATSAATHRGPRFCARNLSVLKKHVAAAFVNDNVNALAGLILWRDYREHGAVRVLRHLSGLLQQPFQGFADAPDSPDLAAKFTPPTGTVPTQDATTAPANGFLRVQLANGPPSIAVFPVTRRDGCLWLEPPEIVPQDNAGSTLSAIHAVR